MDAGFFLKGCTEVLFRILNSGDAFSGVGLGECRIDGTEDGYDSKALALKVSEKGLRYDLTVPFARYVVQHRDEIHGRDHLSVSRKTRLNLFFFKAERPPCLSKTANLYPVPNICIAVSSKEFR